MEDYRSKGSKRTYIFYLREQPFGRFESKLDGRSKLESVSAYRFSEKLSLDLSPFGRDYAIEIESKHYVDDNGYYVGDDMSLLVNDREQKLFLTARPDSIVGYFVRDDSRQDAGVPVSGKTFAADNNMVSQYEIFLAFNDINVGDTIIDTVFVPQTMIRVPVEVIIEDFDWIRYGNLYDSAYVCHFVEPSEQIAYFTRSKKLIRLDQTAQSLQIVLSESPLDKMAPKEKQFRFTDIFWRLPVYLVYLIFGVIFTFPFIKKFYRKPDIYIILILGGALFPLLSITQHPLQRWYANEVVFPGMEAGGSLYYYAILTALMSGFIQELLKLIPIVLFFLLRKPKQLFSIALGIFCGLGFGIYEACSLTGAAYQSGSMEIVSWSVFERIITILFHTTAGAAVGYGINRGLKHLVPIWLVLVIVHSLSNYLVVFLQKGVFDIGILEILLAIIYLVLLLATYILIKKARS